VSNAFDLNRLLDEATACGASALSQVTVVPAFTGMRSGEKAKLSISTLGVGSRSRDHGKADGGTTRMPAANGTARQVMGLNFIRMVRPRCPLS